MGILALDTWPLSCHIRRLPMLPKTRAFTACGKAPLCLSDAPAAYFDLLFGAFVLLFGAFALLGVT